jgi:SecD/SecF fusion protein
MQNRSAIIIFTVLLALACLYSLSFSFFTSKFEADAQEFADFRVDSISNAATVALSADSLDYLEEKYKTQYTRQHGSEPLYPIVGLNYYDCEAQELKKGLDLEGGMSVTLEVSVPDMIINLADNSTSELFITAIADARELQKNADQPFIELFDQAWKSKNEPGQLARVFNSRDNKDKFPLSLTDDEVITILRDEAEAALTNTEKIVRTRIDKFGVTQPTIQRQQFSDRILVELPGAKDKDRIRKMLKSTANLEFWEVYESTELTNNLLELDQTLSKSLYPNLPPLSQNNPNDTIADQPADTLSTGIDSLATQLDDEGIAEVDYASLSSDEQRKYNPLSSMLSPNVYRNQQGQLLIAPGAVVGRAAEEDKEEVMKLLTSKVATNALGYGDRLKFAWGAEPTEDKIYPLYALKVNTRNGKAKLDGDAIVDARQDFSPTGQVSVSMSMDSDGAKVWEEMTKEASGDQATDADNKSIAIVLDNIVYSAPVVNGTIAGGRSEITMGSGGEQALRDAKDLANLLKAGSLPAPANIVDEQIVGPTIGAENIRKGLMSFMIALGVILLYMAFYYRGAGIVSDIALIANMFFLLGALASIGASLTLPGIAGIILTIGMAVDANVLIFERVKEELRLGSGLNAAVNKGYQKAYSAIVDANLTTLFTAFVLYFFGTGPIKGFATTLIIGIFTSLFSAIFLTRLIISYRLDNKKGISFFSEATKNWFQNTAYQFIASRKKFYILSAILIIAGLGSLFTRGLDLGVDFQGGRSTEVEFASEVSIDDVQKSLDAVLIDDDGKLAATQVKKIGGTGRKVKVITNFMMGDTSEGVDSKVDAKLAEAFENIGEFDEGSIVSQKVAPTISDDFRKSSTEAVVIALIIIFLYIAIRFRKWQFGVGALIAMAHDVLIVLGLFSIFWGILPFSLEIDQAFIAAILTVVGYSINDTVVVFDRIREYLSERRGGGAKKVINDALNSTLSRTVNTSLSTFIVLFMIFLFGSDSIKGFTFALMIGVIVGTYSSLCIATPLVVDLTKDDDLTHS